MCVSKVVMAERLPEGVAGAVVHGLKLGAFESAGLEVGAVSRGAERSKIWRFGSRGGRRCRRATRG